MLSGPARSAHPLITEDTGTQGAGRYQLELTLERAHDDEGGVRERSLTSAAVLAYGARDDLDAILTLPLERNRTEFAGATDTARGISDPGADLKWRFYERGELSVALKPGLTYPSGDDAMTAGHTPGAR